MVYRITMRLIGVFFILVSVSLSGCSSIASISGMSLPGTGSSRASRVNEPSINNDGVAVASGRSDKLEDLALDRQAAGLRLLSLGRTDEAVPLLRSALAENSTLVAAREGLGLIYIEQDNYSLAETMFLRVLDAQPERASALNALGVLYDLQERFDEAEKSYRAAIASSPREPKYLNNLGYSYYLQGKFDASKVEFNKAVNLDPGFRTAWSNLALVDARTGDQLGAGQSLEKIGDRHVAQNNLGYLNLLVNEKELARENFKTALSLAPRHYPKAWRNIELMGRPSYATSSLTQSRLSVKQASKSLLQEIDLLPDVPTGTTTELTSRTIQSPNLLVVTGNVSESSRRVERRVSRPETPAITSQESTPSALSVDTSPATVKAIQARLIELGFHPGSIDGTMGNKTVMAIRLYKLAKKLPVNAEVTNELISALEL